MMPQKEKLISKELCESRQKIWLEMTKEYTDSNILLDFIFKNFKNIPNQDNYIFL